MKKILLCLCVIVILSLFSGCMFTLKEPEIQLTTEQLQQIDLLVQNRDEWEEVSDQLSSYPVNQLYVSELSDGSTILHVAYVTYGYGATEGMIYYHAEAFAAHNGVFKWVSPTHKIWGTGCISVDLPNLSDDALKQVLSDAYVDFLSKN